MPPPWPMPPVLQSVQPSEPVGRTHEGFTDPGLTLPSVPAVTLPKVTTTIGGGERSHSVRNGLAALAGHAAADDWVLVHDAARPCVARQDVDQTVGSCSVARCRRNSRGTSRRYAQANGRKQRDYSDGRPNEFVARVDSTDVSGMGVCARHSTKPTGKAGHRLMKPRHWSGSASGPWLLRDPRRI